MLGNAGAAMRNVRATPALTAKATPAWTRGIFAALAVAGGCSKGEPPRWDGGDPAVAPLPAASGAVAVGPGHDGGAPAPSSSAAAPPPAASSAAAAGPDEVAGALPQTHDKPAESSATFDARMRALFEAVQANDPDRAMPAFFPLKAYEQVKAVGNPAGDWRRRLVAAYARDVRALHKRLGKDAERATYVRTEVPGERARWMEPGDEYNKLGYYRVLGTRVFYAIDGKESSFEVTSLISWRGEWYVVHLTGFK